MHPPAQHMAAADRAVRVIPLPGAAAARPAAEMRFTLIVATVGRSTSLIALLASLRAQTHDNFDVIIADQNEDDRIAHILAEHGGGLRIAHVAAPRGLSRARNFALALATGDVVGFPDDDCEYPPDLLHSLARVLVPREDLDGVAVRPRNRRGKPFPRFDRHGGLLDRNNVFRRCSSIGLFFRRELIQRTGGFDERLGLGAGTVWGAGEDVDYPLRAIAAGSRVEYCPDIAVLHDFGIRGHSREERRRGYTYGAGLGWIMRRHGYSRTSTCYHLIMRPCAAIALELLRARPAAARFYFASLRGRVRGWFEA